MVDESVLFRGVEKERWASHKKDFPQDLDWVKKACCPNWARAGLAGSDNDGFSSLLWQNLNTSQRHYGMGSELDFINFCPWCGVKK